MRPVPRVVQGAATGGGRRGGRGGGREIELKHRAGARAGDGADVAMMLFQDGGGGGQAKTAALDLGGEVRAEESLAMLLGDAGAVVHHRHADVRTGWEREPGRVRQGQVAGLEEDLPAARHGLGGVQHKVLHDLADLRGVHLDRPQVGRQAQAAP